MSRATEYAEAKAEKKRLETALRTARAALHKLPDRTAKAALKIASEIDADNHLLIDHNRHMRGKFTEEMKQERLARIRTANFRPDQRYNNVSTYQQQHLFDQLSNQNPRPDSRFEKKLADVAFAASGLTPGQIVKIWKKPVIIKAGASRSQVLVKNHADGNVFESLDRYDAIAEANHRAIAHALEAIDLERAPPPTPKTPTPEPPPQPTLGLFNAPAPEPAPQEA